jgi:hypothetical protein
LAGAMPVTINVRAQTHEARRSMMFPSDWRTQKAKAA